jgi:cardiolipin hydrolase
VDDLSEGKDARSVRTVYNFIMDNFFIYKPVLSDALFFPSRDNEVILLNRLRTCRLSLDIAVFTITNDRIAAAIEEAHKRGVEVRLITDDECCKHNGSDVLKLAMLGIPVKTDNSKEYHMHHKFAIIDKKIVITGSFNWTTQAVLNNQENVLFIEDPGLAKQYCDEFEKLWGLFNTTIKI